MLFSMAANGPSYDLLRPSRVAKMLDVTERTLKRWRDSGTGPRFTMLGPNNIRYSLRDVDAFIDQRARSSTRR